MYYRPFFTYYSVGAYYVTSPTIVQETVVVPQPVYYSQPVYTTGYSTSTLYSSAPAVPTSDATSPYASEPSAQPTTETAASGGTVSATPTTENIAGLAGRPTSEAQPSSTDRSSAERGENKRTDPNGEQLYMLMFEGTNAFAQGDYDASARMFLQVTMQDPENADAALAYAVARFATGDYAISAIAIRRGVRKFGDVVNTGFDIRERYTNKEDFDRHFKSLVSFVSERPDNADGLMVLGFAEHFTGQRDRAMETFNDIKRRFPSDADVADTFIKAKPLAEIQQQEAADQDAAQPSQAAPSSQPAPVTEPQQNSQPAQAPQSTFKEVLPVPPQPALKQIQPTQPQQQWVPLVPKSSATPSSGAQPSSSVPAPTTVKPPETQPAPNSATDQSITPDLFDLEG